MNIMNEVLRLCYCVTKDIYVPEVRAELYTKIIQAARDGKLEEMKSALENEWSVDVTRGQ